jgi:hypothetical protein
MEELEELHIIKKGAENLFTNLPIMHGNNRGASKSFFGSTSIDKNSGEADQLKEVGYYKGMITCYNKEE